MDIDALDLDVGRMQVRATKQTGELGLTIRWSNDPTRAVSVRGDQMLSDWLEKNAKNWDYDRNGAAMQLGGVTLDLDESWDYNEVQDGSTISVSYTVDMNHLVVDLGSDIVKAGRAGRDAPDEQIPPMVQTMDWCGGPPVVGRHAEKAKGARRVIENGVHDKRHMEALYRHIFTEIRADVADEFFYQIHDDQAPEQKGVLLTEKPLTGMSQREATTQMMFEELDVKNFYLASDTALGLFGTARTTGLALDMG